MKSTNGNDIPQAVKDAAKARIAIGGKLVRLGVFMDATVYHCTFREDVTIGYPEVYLWDDSDVQTITGEKALTVLSSFERKS